MNDTELAKLTQVEIDDSETIIRVVHNRENPYVQLNKQSLWDNRLSLKAVGLWARCLSYPNDWKFSVQHLISVCKEGKDAIYAAMKELIEFNYVMRFEHIEKNVGRFKKGRKQLEYIFFETPLTQEEKNEYIEKLKKSFRHPGFPDAGNPDAGNPPLLKNKKTKEKEENKKNIFAQTAPQLRKKDPEISFSFETKNFENINAQDIKTWKELYPDIDVHRALKEMIEWILSNPSKARSKKLWRKFISGWLQRSNEKASNKAAYQQINQKQVLARHTGLQQDHRPRDPKLTMDFSECYLT